MIINLFVIILIWALSFVPFLFYKKIKKKRGSSGTRTRVTTSLRLYDTATPMTLLIKEKAHHLIHSSKFLKGWTPLWEKANLNQHLMGYLRGRRKENKSFTTNNLFNAQTRTKKKLRKLGLPSLGLILGTISFFLKWNA